jgi:predicted GTPase
MDTAEQAGAAGIEDLPAAVEAPGAAADAAAMLAECIEAATSLPGADAAACRQLRQRLAEGAFNLVVAGEFKRGKSSVINALLGAPVLPVAVVPLTSVITVVVHGEWPGGEVRFLDGSTRDIALDAVADFVTERANPGNGKAVDSVTVAYPSERLRGGLRIIDTPGIGSVHQHNTDVAYRCLPQADAVLFVASVDQPLGRAELDFLVEIRRYANKVFCLLNKADYLSAAELREAVEFATRAVRQALDAPVPVIAFSARLVAEGAPQGDAALLQGGGLAELERALKRLLGEERRAVWLDSMTRALARILAQSRLAIGLELKALAEPLAEIEAKLALFADMKSAALQAMNDDEILLAAETARLQKNRVEPALERFKAQQKSRLRAGVERRFGELKERPLRQLQAELEQFAVAEIRAAYDDWRAERDTELRREFNALCGRFSAHIQDIAEALLDRAAELFSLRFESARSASDWEAQPDFYYKFWNEPTGLHMLGASLLLLLPKAIAAPRVRDRVAQMAVDLVETQAGRVRHSFEERLKESMLAFRREMLARMEATVAGIEGAIASGVELRRRGEAGVASRHEVLASSLRQIERLQARLRELAP